MKNNKSLEIKVGIVSLLSLVIFIVCMALVSGNGFSNKENIIKLRFPSSGGIKPTSPVVVNGVKRGMVLKIVNDNGGVLITASMDKLDDIREDVRASISILEITGGKKIDLYPGNSPNHFDKNLEIKGNTSTDIGELVAKVGEISGDATSLVRRLDTLAGRANLILADTNVIINLKSSLKNLSELSANANNLLKNNTSKIESTIDALKVLTNELKNAVKNDEPKVSKLIDDINSTVLDARKTIETTDNTIKNANNFVNEINQVVKDLKSNGSLVNRMLYDRSLSSKIDSTVSRLEKLVDFIYNNGVNVNVRLGTRP